MTLLRIAISAPLGNQAISSHVFCTRSLPHSANGECSSTRQLLPSLHLSSIVSTKEKTRVHDAEHSQSRVSSLPIQCCTRCLVPMPSPKLPHTDPARKPSKPSVPITMQPSPSTSFLEAYYFANISIKDSIFVAALLRIQTRNLT